MEEGFEMNTLHQHLVSHREFDEDFCRLPWLWIYVEALQLHFSFVGLLHGEYLVSGLLNPLSSQFTLSHSDSRISQHFMANNSRNMILNDIQSTLHDIKHYMNGIYDILRTCVKEGR